MRALLATLMIAACAPPTAAQSFSGVDGCHAYAGGGVICSSLDLDVGAYALGAIAWRDVYRAEWGDDVDRVLLDTVVIVADLDVTPTCPCRQDAGCMDPNSNYGGVRYATLSDVWTYPHLTHSAMQHELTHAAEWQIEGRADPEHDDKPWRWDGALVRAARAGWEDLI